MNELVLLAAGARRLLEWPQTESVGVLSGRSVLFVSLDDADDCIELLRPARDLPFIIVGLSAEPKQIGPVTADLLITDEPNPPYPWVACKIDAAIQMISRTVDQWPRASVALVQVLRLQQQLSVPDALVAESLAYAMLQSGSEHQMWLSSRELVFDNIDEPEPVVTKRTTKELIVEINRPKQRNAINATVRDRLIELFEFATYDQSVHNVTLRGAGKCFSIGGELAEFGSTTDTSFSHFIRSTRSLPLATLGCADRLTVEIDGAAIGAGLEIAAFANDARATKRSWFQLPELSMGLIPGSGGTVSITRRIGRERAAYMALTRERIRSTRALQWGLIDALD